MIETCGGLKESDLQREWRYEEVGLIRGGVSSWRPALRSHIYSGYAQSLRPLPVAKMLSRYENSQLLL